MSKEIETGGSNKTYYSIVGGTFTTKVTQSHSQAKERINKLGKQVFEREVGGLEGTIENIDIEQSEYGPQLKITLSATSDGKNPVIGIGLETKHGRELLRKLPAVNLEEDVRFIPYKFTPEGADDPISGLNLFQNDVKVQSHFWDANSKTFKENHPTIDWDAASESQKKIYKITRDEFLKSYLITQILPKFDRRDNGIEFAPTDVRAQDISPDEIPFWFMSLSSHIQAAKDAFRELPSYRSSGYHIMKDDVESLITSRLTLLAEDFKSVVPEEKEEDWRDIESIPAAQAIAIADHNIHWNACRTQTLTNIKQLLQ